MRLNVLVVLFCVAFSVVGYGQDQSRLEYAVKFVCGNPPGLSWRPEFTTRRSMFTTQTKSQSCSEKK